MTLPTDPGWLWRLWTGTQETRPERSGANSDVLRISTTDTALAGPSGFVAFQSNKMINQVSIEMSTIRNSDILSRRIGRRLFSSHLTNVVPCRTQARASHRDTENIYIRTSEICLSGYFSAECLECDAVSPDTGLTCMLMLPQCNDESRVAGLCLSVSAMSDAGGNYCYYTMIDAMIYKLSDNRSPQLSAQSQTPQFSQSFTKHPIVASDRWINSNYCSARHQILF